MMLVAVAEIAGTLSSLQHCLCANLVSIVGQTEKCHDVNEDLCKVEDATKLGCRIILWKCVMIVVKALANGTYRHKDILSWVDATIVGSIAPHVRHTINEPCYMQRKHVAKDG